MHASSYHYLHIIIGYVSINPQCLSGSPVVKLGAIDLLHEGAIALNICVITIYHASIYSQFFFLDTGPHPLYQDDLGLLPLPMYRHPNARHWHHHSLQGSQMTSLISVTNLISICTTRTTQLSMTTMNVHHQLFLTLPPLLLLLLTHPYLLNRDRLAAMLPILHREFTVYFTHILMVCHYVAL